MNAPTLIVGVGGAGSKIVERVSNLTKGNHDDIAFVVFDTDINELKEIQQRNPFIRTIQTSTKQTVGEYLNKDTHARDTWFPVNAILNSKTLTEGAGQVRAVSRLALETVIRAGKMEPLHEAIQSLYKVEEDKVEQALRVVVVGSLAGGTGSGLILPLGLYIKNYLATHFRQSANITRGFFILPEVFDEVIRGAAEKNNLKANAYASLRELDAFLMKGDQTLHERYKDSVVMQFPRVASDGYEEYDVRPYDYCFLFDAQNADGGKLNSYAQYLDHAANCIYAQSIGPMNKRSNSSEDNTIRQIAHERGRNRYAGAGASVMEYPIEDVKKYVALQWAKEGVSKQWLVFDNQYLAYLDEVRKSEEDGASVERRSEDDYYKQAISDAAGSEDPFAKAIMRVCSNYNEDGTEVVSYKWDEYVAALSSHIERLLEAAKKDSGDVKNRVKKINDGFSKLKNEWKSYTALYRLIEEYKSSTELYVKESAKMLAYNMFKASRDTKSKNPEDFELEYYLVGNNQAFIHPNAVRFFLCNVKTLLLDEIEAARGVVEEKEQWFKAAEKKIFDNPSTPEQETAAVMAGKPVKGMSKEKSADQERAASQLDQYYKAVDAYKYNYMLREVMKAAYDYVEDLLKAYRVFYKSFRGKVETIDKDIVAISKRYVNRPGSTRRYVCADTVCLEKIKEKTKYTGSAITIDSDLARDIYYSVLEYAVSVKDEDDDNQSSASVKNKFFSKLFDEGIMGYYKKLAMESYAEQIDIDIIHALEKEAVYVNPEYAKAENADELIEQYVKNTISNVRKLSCPFIERPLANAGDGIDACTYNKTMETELCLDPRKEDLIRSELRNYGAQPDDEISRYVIMFYKSFYGLRANDLSKFAPPEKSATYNRESGEYFKAYYELIEGIHPESHLSRELSPHIDRWWHIVTKLPDLDEENQLRQENAINAAFFWAILNRYIQRQEEYAGSFRYVLDKEELEMEYDSLIVSNGTPCDKLYEVLDAVAIYPHLVNRIMERVDAKIFDDVNKNRDKSIEKGMLLKNLEKFALVEPGLGASEAPVAATSIFSIPLLMKKSATPDMYYEENVLRIIKTEVAEIRRYLLNFYREKELPEAMGKILKTQFDKYLADMAIEAKTHTTVYRESLFHQTCATIAKAFDAIGLEDYAEEVRDMADKLRK